jgi:acetyl-CoA carboxylase biotin carboxyl carrier protein
MTQADKPDADRLVDPKWIRDVADILRESDDLGEIEVENGGLRLRVARATQHHGLAGPDIHVGPIGSAAPAAPAPTAQAQPEPAVSQNVPETPVGPGSVDPHDHPGAVLSPMVGTAYHAPEPGAAPFIGVGDQVTEGQTVMIIEAMKTMNAIPAHRSGTVQEVLVENEQPVQFGDPLLIIA